jgi:hypothetical protein
LADCREDTVFIGSNRECDRRGIMNRRLREALEIISDVDAKDASISARGHRAHARVIALIEYAEQVTGIREQALIANLLTSRA